VIEVLKVITPIHETGEPHQVETIQPPPIVQIPPNLTTGVIYEPATYQANKSIYRALRQ